MTNQQKVQAFLIRAGVPRLLARIIVGAFFLIAVGACLVIVVASRIFVFLLDSREDKPNQIEEEDKAAQEALDDYLFAAEYERVRKNQPYTHYDNNGRRS